MHNTDAENIHIFLLKRKGGHFLAVQWARLDAFTAGAQVQFLVGEIRS